MGHWKFITVYGLLATIFFLYQTGLSQPGIDGRHTSDSTVSTFSGNLANRSWYPNFINSTINALVLEVQYNVTIPKNDCCAFIDLAVEGFWDDFEPCIPDGLLYRSYTKHTHNLSQNQNCRGTHCVSTGKIYGQLPTETDWVLTVGHLCGRNKTITLQYTITINSTNKVVCRNLSDLPNKTDHALYKIKNICSKFYDQFSLPNILGHMSYEDFNDPLANLLSNISCYQHFNKYGCYALLPMCNNSQVYFPCQRTCQAVTKYCSHILKENSIPDFFCIGISHKYCYHDPIHCGELPPIDHGSVSNSTISYTLNSTATYTCNVGYNKRRADTMSVICQPTGLWSERPECIFDFQTLSITLAVLVAITILLVVLIIHFRLEIAAIMYSKFPNLFVKDESEDLPYDAFVAFNETQLDFVIHELMPRLENNISPSFRLCVHFRDFGVGEYIVDNIVKAIKSSKRTIAVVSQDFINSEWCQLELAQAELRSRGKFEHRLIIILMQDIQDLHNIPDGIRAYINTRTFLRRTDRLFWQKLMFSLPKPQRRQVIATTQL